LFIREEKFGRLLFNGKSQVTIDKNMYGFVRKNKSRKIKLGDFAKALYVSTEDAKKQ